MNEEEALERARQAGRQRQRSSTSPRESTRVALYALAGVLTVGGSFSTWAAWHLAVEPLLIAAVAAPALVGLRMLLEAPRAKRLDEVDTDA